MSEVSGHRIFRFGAFEASESSGELRKHGIRIKMHAQPFRVLIMLLERSSEIVTREQVREKLWGKDTFVDFDHGLNTAVNKIREALDDSASKPRYVETVPGKGYRFIAPLERTMPMPVQTSVVAMSEGSAGGPAARPTQVHEPPTNRREDLSTMILTAPCELPVASRKLVRNLLLLMQAMYVGFYVGALANLPEIRDVLVEADLPQILMGALITTGAVLIPIRLYIFTAAAMNFHDLPAKFGKMFPVLLILDLLWSVSPFLLIHHVSAGLALGMSAPLVYLPFAQRSLVLMYARDGANALIDQPQRRTSG